MLLALNAILLLAGIALVALGINETSSGALRAAPEPGGDPALIAGEPLAIRSDEWNVGTVWSIAQLEDGLPEVSRGVPGGMDAAIPYDLPRSDWSAAFRPQPLGYLVLDADRATAWKWCVPGLTLIAAGYALVVTALPRHPVTRARGSRFAQEHVDFVLADAALPDRCVRSVDEYATPDGTLYEYEIVRG